MSPDQGAFASQRGRFIEYDISDDMTREKEMRKGSPRRRCRIIDHVHVGGCDNLMAMDRQGSLDRMLKD